jgi:hypothetical protein
MPAASEIVEFVNEVAVMPAGVKIRQQFAGGNRDYDRTGAANEFQ